VVDWITDRFDRDVPTHHRHLTAEVDVLELFVDARTQTQRLEIAPRRGQEHIGRTASPVTVRRIELRFEILPRSADYDHSLVDRYGRAEARRAPGRHQLLGLGPVAEAVAPEDVRGAGRTHHQFSFRHAQRAAEAVTGPPVERAQCGAPDEPTVCTQLEYVDNARARVTRRARDERPTFVLQRYGKLRHAVRRRWPQGLSPRPRAAAVALVDIGCSLVADDRQAVAPGDRAAKSSVWDRRMECLYAPPAVRRLVLVEHRNGAAERKRNADESDAIAHRDSVAEAQVDAGRNPSVVDFEIRGKVRTESVGDRVLRQFSCGAWARQHSEREPSG